MASTGEQLVDEIRFDLACPNCEYNLRGLSGAEVSCPECGTLCNVAQLVSRRWTRPWWNAPHFNRVIVPAAWAYVFFVFGWLAVAATGAELAVFAASALIWAGLMYRAWAVFRDWRGVAYPLLAHAVAGATRRG